MKASSHLQKLVRQEAPSAGILGNCVQTVPGSSTWESAGVISDLHTAALIPTTDTLNCFFFFFPFFFSELVGCYFKQELLCPSGPLASFCEAFFF